MAGKLSFAIAINLLTENFKRGTNNVKAGFRAMQMQVLTFAAALGAGGLGLSNFVTRLIDVARETSRVTTALKNVSGTMNQYADNQRYLVDLAKKYGLEINALTGNYAKFTAAATISGMTMADQRKIFESTSRACTAFGMSADDSNSVFLALSQMMSKGKISSEELRLQMGERLPIALQAMAKAAGVSVGGLDKLMKQGKLMSADILPKFADALNEMIPNVDTDNLETSMNRLKNAFTEFAKGADIQSKYKALIDWLTGAVESAGENIKNIVIGVVAVIAGVAANGAKKLWVSISGTTAQLEAAAIRSNTALVAATASRIAAEIALEEAKVAANNATGSALLSAKQKVIQAEKALTAASAAEQVEIENVKVSELKVLDAKRLSDVTATAKASAAITRKKVAAEIELEEAKQGVIIASESKVLAARQRLSAAEKNLAKLTKQEIAAQESAKVATIQAASVKSANWWDRSCTKMKSAGAKLVVSLKAMWSSFAPMIIITAIAAIIGKFVEMYQEAKRIKNIFSDYKKESQISGYTQEVVALKQQLKIMNDKKQSQENINNAQAQLQKMLGVEHKSQEELNKLVAKRVDLLKETARADFHAKKVVESEETLREVGNKEYNRKTVKEMAPDWAMSRGDLVKEERFKAKYKVTMSDGIGWENGLENDLNSYIEQSKILKHSTAELEKSTVAANEILNTTTPLDTPDDKKTDLQKAEEEYANKLKEYANQRENGALKEQEYNKAIDELNEATYKKIGGLLTPEKALQNETFAKAMVGTYNPRYDETKVKTSEEFEKVQKEYSEKIKEYQAEQSKGLISQKELDENIASLSVESAKSAASIKGIGNTADGFITEMMAAANARIPSVKKKDRDTTFDYKKSNVDIAGETLDNAKEYAKELQEQAKKTGKELSDELAKAMANVPSLEQALKLAEVQEDIKQLGKELDESLYSGIKNTVGIADSLVSSFKSLEEAFDPESEADGWERLMAIWNAMTTVVDSFLSIADMMEDITELTNKLVGAKVAEEEVTKGVAAAKGVEATVDTSTTLAKVANDSIETASAVTATGTKAAASVAASGVEAAAYHAAMVAGATAAFAAIPVVGPVLAAGQIAAMEALMLASAIPFAKGGIITGGPSSGDKILARVNAGEMILNGGQQANLFDAINSGHLGSSGSSSTITTKIRSKDLILIINNELKSQGKKPIS